MDTPIEAQLNNAQEVFKRTVDSCPKRFSIDDFCKRFKAMYLDMKKANIEEVEGKKDKRMRLEEAKELKGRLRILFEKLLSSLVGPLGRNILLVLSGILIGIILMYTNPFLCLPLLGLSIFVCKMDKIFDGIRGLMKKKM